MPHTTAIPNALNARFHNCAYAFGEAFVHYICLNRSFTKNILYDDDHSPENHLVHDVLAILLTNIL